MVSGFFYSLFTIQHLQINVNIRKKTWKNWQILSFTCFMYSGRCNVSIDLTTRVANRVISVVPSKNVKSKWLQGKIEYIGEKFSPTHNRLILGVSALLSQPLIDLHNKDVDEKTRKMSAARTIAKIIAGTFTGVIIREACIRGIEAWTKTPEELKKAGKKVTKWNTLLVPNKTKENNKWVEGFTHEKFGNAVRLIKNHRKTLGTLIAIGIMAFTNFLIDVPLTKYFTNILSKKMDNEDKSKGGQK